MTVIDLLPILDGHVRAFEALSFRIAPNLLGAPRLQRWHISLNERGCP